MSNYSWFKHPKDLSNDKRVSALIAREGGKGYGTYMYIIEILHMQPDGKLSFQQLNTMKRKGFAKSYMEKIVREFQLFIIKDSEFKSIIYYSFSTDECAVVASNSSDTQRVFDEYTSSTEETPEQIEIPKTTDNQHDISNIDRKLTLAHVREEKIREEKSRTEQNKAEPNDDGGTTKIGSWRTLIDNLLPDSEWKEMACMKRRIHPSMELAMTHVGLPPKCHTRAPQMPHLSSPNATAQHSKCHTSRCTGCGIRGPRMWQPGS